MIALAFPFLRFSIETATGAPFSLFFVNIAAALHTFSQYISAKSFLSLCFLIPE